MWVKLFILTQCTNFDRLVSFAKPFRSSNFSITSAPNQPARSTRSHHQISRSTLPASTPSSLSLSKIVPTESNYRSSQATTSTPATTSISRVNSIISKFSTEFKKIIQECNASIEEFKVEKESEIINFIMDKIADLKTIISDCEDELSSLNVEANRLLQPVSLLSSPLLPQLQRFSPTTNFWFFF